jgi:hypothetical protein
MKFSILQIIASAIIALALAAFFTLFIVVPMNILVAYKVGFFLYTFSLFMINELRYADLDKGQREMKKELTDLQEKVMELQGNNNTFKDAMQTEMQANLKAHQAASKSMIELNDIIQNIVKLL